MITYIMPAIAAIGCIIIVIVIILSNNATKREKLKANNVKSTNELFQQLMIENSEIKENIKEMKEKVDSMEKMMKDI